MQNAEMKEAGAGAGASAPAEGTAATIKVIIQPISGDAACEIDSVDPRSTLFVVKREVAQKIGCPPHEQEFFAVCDAADAAADAAAENLLDSAIVGELAKGQDSLTLLFMRLLGNRIFSPHKTDQIGEIFSYMIVLYEISSRESPQESTCYLGKK